MKKETIIKIISLILNLAIFFGTAFVVVRAVFFGYHFGDIKVKAYEFSYFKYFTNLSNIYAALVALYLFIYTIIHFKDDKPLPHWLSIVELGSATSVALTFITVLVFLGPTTAMNGGNYFVMFMDDLIFTHFLNPVISCIIFLFLMKHHSINYKEALLGVIPMLIYSIIYSSLVLGGIWDDFYGFTFGGNYWAIIIVLPIMIGVSYLISFLLSLITRGKAQ